MRPRPRLLIIDPSVKWAEEEGVANVTGDWPGEVHLLQPALTPGDGPGPATGYDWDGVILLGSSSSVHDKLDWLADLSHWLHPLLDGTHPLPFLGICFGHQLAAHLTGGRVAHLHPDGSKELGIVESHLEGGRLLPGTRQIRTLVSHNEAVVEIPPGYRVVASRDGVPVDGLEHRELPIFTFQFHPEARDVFAARRGLDLSLVDDRLGADGDALLGAFREWILYRR